MNTLWNIRWFFSAKLVISVDKMLLYEHPIFQRLTNSICCHCDIPTEKRLIDRFSLGNSSFIDNNENVISWRNIDFNNIMSFHTIKLLNIVAQPRLHLKISECLHWPSFDQHHLIQRLFDNKAMSYSNSLLNTVGKGKMGI